MKDTSGSGGAIYFHCNPDYLNCKLIIQKTTFQNNFASIKGGTIYWDEVKPIIDRLTTFSNNNALLYGNDIAAFSNQLVLITRE